MARPVHIVPTRLLRQIPLWATLALLLVALTNVLGTALGSLPAWANALLDFCSSLAAVFLGIFIEAAPFLLLGTLASGILEAFVDPADLARWLPRNPLLAAVAGSLIGLFFPVCECGVVPFSRRLIHKGAPVSVGIAALLAAPVLNPIVIASTLAAFGPGLIFWGRLSFTLLIATLTGWIFSRHPRPQELLRQDSLAVVPLVPNLPAETPAQPIPARSVAARLRSALLISADEFFEMGRYLVLGALMAALAQTVIRQPALLSIGQGPLLSVLVMLALAVLLSICSTVDAFIALAFTGVFTSGAVLAFLLYGPMVDIKSTLMFLRLFKPRPVAVLVLLPLVMTLLVTVCLNYFGPAWGIR